MIRVATAARTMPAVWLALPLIALAAWYVTLLPSSQGYGVAATGLSSLVLVIVAPFAAGCAAWEGARLRAAGIWASPHVRSRPAIAFWTLLPVGGVAAMAVAVSTALALGIDGAWPPESTILAVETSAIVSAAVFGLAVGVHLPLPIAGPVALLLPFALTALVPAMEPSWLRHLTSTFRDCCWIEQQLAPGAAAASAIVNGVVFLVCGVILVFDRPGRLLTAAGVVGLAAMVAASGLVMNLGYAPVQPRDPAGLACHTAGTVTLCVWPEHRSQAGHLADVVQRVRARWEAAGINTPSTFTEADRTFAPEGSVAVRFDLHQDDDGVIAALAAAMLPGAPACEGGATGYIATEYLAAWLSAAGGMSDEALAERFGADQSPFPSALALVELLRTRSPEARGAWMRRAAAVSQMCDLWPPGMLVP